MTMRAYVEVHTDDGGGMSSRAWSFDLAHWGVAREAETPTGAVTLLQRATRASTIELEELVEGEDPAFARDLKPATPGQRAATMTILEHARKRTLAIVAAATRDQLSRPTAWLPDIDARGWQSAEELAWSIAEVESRVYLPALGCPSREAEADLLDELAESHRHVLEVVGSLPDVLIATTPAGGEWSSVKLLRMLAWRERSMIPLLQSLIVPTD